MITLENDQLVFSFPKVHEDANCSIGFQRTLRIPDDGKSYPLPPGLGRFPLRHLDDFAAQLSESWLARGGVVMPIHQAEAMWIRFAGGGHLYDAADFLADLQSVIDGVERRQTKYPFAVKVATGKINAVTGEAWVNNLNGDPQDYVVLPEQPWLDGYCVEKGYIRQFVAMPLGEGYSAEEQLTGKAELGGVQITVYPMKAARYEALLKARAAKAREWPVLGLVCRQETPGAMGLAPGGRMRQKIYDDPYGLDAWDQRNCSRCFITIANSTAWMAITGEGPPTKPPTAKAYTEAGLPWFEYYDADKKALEGAEKLKNLKSVTAKVQEKGEGPLQDNESVEIAQLVHLKKQGTNTVRETSL